jgi:hypothetical protein
LAAWLFEEQNRIKPAYGRGNLRAKIGRLEMGETPLGVVPDPNSKAVKVSNFLDP